MRYLRILGLALVLLISVQLSGAKNASDSQKLTGDSKINMRSANTYKNIGEWDKALERYLDVVNEKPEYVEALKIIGDIYFYFAEEEPAEATKNYKESFNYYDRAITAYDKYQDIKGIEKFKKEIDEAHLKKRAVWARLFNNGQQKLSQKDYDAALAEFTQLSEMTPDSTKIYMMLASIYQGKDNLDKAAEYFELIAAKDETDVVSRKNLAIHHFQAKEYDKALNWYEKVIMLEPNDPDNYYWSGVICMSMDKKEDALSFFEKSFEVDPNFVDGLSYAANIAFSQRYFDKAAAYYKRLHELEPNDEDIILNLLYNLSRLQDYDGMIKYGQELYELNNNSIEAVQLIVLAAQKTNNKELQKKYIDILNKLSK